MTDQTPTEIRYPSDIVDRPGDDNPKPTQPTTDRGRQVDTSGALTTLAIAISGVAYSASQGGELVGYPIGASFAAMAIGAVVLYRQPNGGQR